MKDNRYKVPKDVFTAKRPNYYKINKHQDLFDVFKSGLLTHTQYEGFILGNLYKYSFRFNKKGQAQSDLNKMVVYAKALRDFELDNKGA